MQGIIPQVQVECIEAYVRKETVLEYLQGDWDYVIDCIDNVGMIYNNRG